ncbi:GSCOCG00013673001-RA-CDS [Cotesia congregata]|nr:GSCOCG00013673001-RA-CDS [Cotesia congregata]
MMRFLFFLTLSLVAIYEANACSCAAFPLQHLFCESDFVIKMKIDDLPENKESSYLMYKVDILETYKESDAAKSALKNRLVATNLESGICGLIYKQGDVVVVGGGIMNGVPHISLCELHIENAEKIAAEETNLRENFIKTCVSVVN